MKLFVVILCTLALAVGMDQENDEDNIIANLNFAFSLSENNSNFAGYENTTNITKQCSLRDFFGVYDYVPCPTSDECEDKDEGLAVLTYKNTCAKCLGTVGGWSMFIFLATFPTTIFLLIVYGCGIKATSAPMNGIVCASQVALYTFEMLLNSASDLFEFYHQRIYAIIIPFSIWNLDFLRYSLPLFCINKKLTTLNILSMEYIIAVYPLACIVTIYICIELHDKDVRLLKLMWKPLGKCLSKTCFKNYNPKMSIIEIFATFLILAYTKILYTSLNLVAFTKLVVNTEVDTENTSYVLLYDISVPYLGSEHLPFFILAILILFIFNILPLLFLLLYPTKLFQKALGCCTRIRWHPLHAFADAFQGCYKNGTNGTSDCRYFAGLYLLLRALFRVPGFYMFTNRIESALLFILLCHSFAILHGIVRPYRNDLYNKWDLFLFFLLPLGQFWSVSDFFGSLIMPTEGLIVLVGLTYYAIIVTYKILSVCAPRLLERCCYKAGVQKRQRDTEQGLTNENDDDELPDRLENPQDYQPLQPTLRGKDANEGATNENRPITGCYYTYGSCN